MTCMLVYGAIYNICIHTWHIHMVHIVYNMLPQFNSSKFQRRVNNNNNKRKRKENHIIYTIRVWAYDTHTHIHFYLVMLWFEAVQKLYSIMCRLNHFYCRCWYCGNGTHFTVFARVAEFTVTEKMKSKEEYIVVLCVELFEFMVLYE